MAYGCPFTFTTALPIFARSPGVNPSVAVRSTASDGNACAVITLRREIA